MNTFPGKAISRAIFFASVVLLLLSSCTKTSEGQSGFNSLVRTSQLAPGLSCQNGGVKIESGLDKNRNGKLDDEEISSSEVQIICNSAPMVRYSPWIDANSLSGEGDWADTTISGSFHRRAILFTPALTQAIYDKGIVLVYVEDNYSSSVPVVSLLPYKVSFDANSFDDFKAYLNTGKITLTWQAVEDGSVIDLPFLVPNLRYRYVIIPEGAVINGPGLQARDLKSKTYNEIKSLYGIPDKGTNL